MTTENITQLTPQVGSADTTSLLYAVTGTSGNFSDTSLPLSVFVNNLGLTGVPTVPTAVIGTSTTQIASCAFVQSQLTSSLAPYALKSGNLSQFAATTSAQLAGVISDETGTGSLVFGTSPAITTPVITGGSINNMPIGATTANTGAFTTLSASGTVSGAGFTTLLAPYAPLVSPALTGTPTAPTAANGTNTTQLATTAFVASTLASPPAIGATTPSTGKFTTLTTTASAKVIANNTSAQSIPNNAVTVVTNWTTTTNQGSNFVASTGIFTAPIAGFYRVNAQFLFSAAVWPTNSTVAVIVNKNGVAQNQSVTVAAGTASINLATGTVSCLINCAANDTISISAYQASGAALTIFNNALDNYLCIEQAP